MYPGVGTFVLIRPTQTFYERINLAFTADGIKAPLFILPRDDALATGDFIWRVQAADEAGNAGIFSVPFTFEVVQDVVPPGRPTTLSPSTGDVLEDPTPTFSWRQVIDDSGVTYNLEIAHAGVVSGDQIVTGDQIPTGDQILTGDFDNPVFSRTDIPEPVGTGDVQFTLPEENILAIGRYFWRVRAVDGAGIVGPFSTADFFSIVEDTTHPGAPRLISPRNFSSGSNATPTFTLTTVVDLSGVDRYTLEIVLAGIVSGDQILTGDQIPLGVQPDTGDFGNPVFTADLPDGPVTADRIRFTLGSGGALTTGGTLASGDPLATGDYIWRVRAVDTKGNSGDFSLPFFFALTADAPAPSLVPVLISPTTGDVTDDKTPTFTWSPVTGDLSPVTYTIEIASAGILSGDQILTGDQIPTGDQLQTGGVIRTGDFDNPVFTGDVLEPVTGDVQFKLPEGDPLDTGDFFWRVKAVDGAGNTGDFGGPFILTVPEDITPPPKPTLLEPADGAQDLQPTPVFRWSEVTDPSGVAYELEIAFGTVDFTNLAFTADRILARVFALPADRALAPGDYVWHVRASDGFSNTGDFSDSFTFNVFRDTESPTTPVLLAPATGDIVETARPTFQWSQSTDPSEPVTYLLQVSTTGDFSILSSLLINVSVGVETSFRPKVQLPGGTFFWHVVALDSGFVPNTADSGVRIFTVLGTPEGLTMEPFLSGPGTADYVPTLRWQAVPEAIRYEISVDNGPFRDIGTGDPGAPDGEVKFELKKPLLPPSLAPVLISPLGGSTTDNTQPTFTWRPVTGDLSPVTYTLEIDFATGDFTVPIRSTGGIPEPVFVTGDVGFTLSEAQVLPIGDYIWRVIAEDGVGNTGDSRTFSFTIVEDTTPPSPATLLIPSDGATGSNTTPTFVWTRVPDSSGVTYTLEVTTGGLPATGTFVNAAFATGDFLNPVFAGDVADSPVTADRIQFTLPESLATGDYIWHVLAVDGQGKSGDFSVAFAFTVTANAPVVFLVPGLISPPTLSTLDDLTPTFVWSQVTGDGDLSPVTYNLEIATAPTGDFNNLVVTIDVPEPLGTDDVRFTLPDGSALVTGDFIWRVRAVDGAGNSGDSATSLFTVTGDQILVPTLISPRIGSTGGNTTPTFTWTRVADPSGVTYTLQIAARIVTGDGSVTGDFDNPVLTAEVSDEPVTADRIRLALTSGDALATGDYLWRVRATDGKGITGDFSGLFSFAVEEPFIDDPIAFGPHHIFQVRAVVTGSTLRGGIASLFFSDNVVAPGGTATPDAPLTSTLSVPDEDFLPLGEHIIQISGLDRLENTGKLEDAQLLFKVSQLAISLQPTTQTVVVPGQATTVTVQIEPRGLPVDGAEISIDFDSRLAFAGISSGGGITIDPADIRLGVSTVDFKASFAALTGTEPPLTLAEIQFNTSTSFRPTEPNVVLVTTSDRNTVGRFEGRDVPAVLKDATVAVNAPPTAIAVGPPGVVLVGQPAPPIFVGTDSFDGPTATAPDGTIVSFTWSFGDGGLGFGSVTSHSYQQAGVFPVTLTVTDNDGATDTATIAVTVESGAV